ncbi:hypothetical protein HY993_02375 [Candidatus Micrarchaeota archaeon]|nr:hypothetical protein [Candidatus Micrarchaeota archaeon]
MKVVNLTIAVSTDLKKQLDENPEINWSEVARQSFKKKLDDLAILNEFSKDSALTQKDVERLSRKVGLALTKRLEKAAKSN